MEKNWPFFNSMLDILDMVISKVDPEISKVYEKYLADYKLIRIGKKLRYQFETIKKLNKKSNTYSNIHIIKQHIMNEQQFNTSLIVFFNNVHKMQQHTYEIKSST